MWYRPPISRLLIENSAHLLDSSWSALRDVEFVYEGVLRYVGELDTPERKALKGNSKGHSRFVMTSQPTSIAMSNTTIIVSRSRTKCTHYSEIESASETVFPISMADNLFPCATNR